MVAVHWFDKCDVFAMSTIHGTGNVEVTRRGDEQSFQKPDIINEYNKFMVGVDQCDQLIARTHSTENQSTGGKKVFFRMLEVPVVNSKHLYALLYPEQSNSRLYKRFQENLEHEVVQPQLDEKGSPVPAVNPNETWLTGKHFAESKYPQRKTCTSCGYKKDAKGRQSRKKTCNFCRKCDRFIRKDCFR